MTFWLLLSILLSQGPLPRNEGGVITGIVRHVDGRPAAGVRVAAMLVPDTGLAAGNASTLASLAQTDASGSYRLENIPPGRYYIIAGRVDLPTFYPGVAGMADAKSIAVTAGSLTSAVDFVITPESARPAPPPSPFAGFPVRLVFANTIPVAGRVVLEATTKGANLPDKIVLEIRTESSATRTAGIPMSTSSSIRLEIPRDGTFTVPLREGDTTIRVYGLPEGYSVKSITSGTTNLARPFIVQAGMPEIVIMLSVDLRPRFKVGGRIPEGANGALLGEQIELINDSGEAVRLILDAEGRFEFHRVMPGAYVLRPATSGLHTAEQRITVSDRDVTIELGTVR